MRARSSLLIASSISLMSATWTARRAASRPTAATLCGAPSAPAVRGPAPASMSSSASIPLLSTRSAVGSLIGRLAGEVEPSGAPGSASREAWYNSGMTTSTDTITARLFAGLETQTAERRTQHTFLLTETCLLYTSDAADGLLCVDLG